VHNRCRRLIQIFGFRFDFAPAWIRSAHNRFLYRAHEFRVICFFVCTLFRFSEIECAKFLSQQTSEKEQKTVRFALLNVLVLLFGECE
jgi:hypothetical protein